MNATARTLAEFAAGLRPQDLPDHVVHAVKRHAIDAIGVALAASGTGAGRPVVEAVRSWAGSREASLLGTDARAPAAWAALANGTLVHALDYDDTHPESVVHPSAAVVPAAIAAAEEAGASGAETIAAAVAGYEVATRIGAAAPGRFHPRGLHPTGLCGPFGAAAAAGRVWGLDADAMTAALGIAGSQSSGLFAYVTDGSETKRLHGGWAAHAGVIAADLARRGFTGPAAVLDGPNGFFDAFLAGESPDLARVTRALGREWEVARIAIKPYPCCHFLHAFIDAARRAGVRAEEVEEVECAIPPTAIGIVCEPREVRLRPPTTYAAQFSLPFAVAAALVGGRDELEMFGEPARTDRRVLELAARVRHVPDETLPFPYAFGGRLRVHTRHGETIAIDEPINRGHPDRPLPDEEVSAKFLANATRRLDRGATEKLLDLLWRIEEADSLSEPLALAQAP